ncbi:MAG: ERCC4 domain-containing protein [Candidatus Bathyarchaeia archaeon]
MVKVIVDHRESSSVKEALRELGVEVSVEAITPGDYVVGEDYAVERKTLSDLLSSIYQKRLFEQLRRLKEAYPQCCLIVEGDLEEGLGLMENPLVFWGTLSWAAVDCPLPILLTLDQEQTAQLLFSLARRLQGEVEGPREARYKPKFHELRQQQLFAVQGLPGVGPKLAERLLEAFGSVRGVFKASEEEVQKVEGFGKKRANEIVNLLDLPYSREDL